MRLVYQRTGAVPGQNGDCFAACVASVFSLRLEHVPDFNGGVENGKLLPRANLELLRTWLKGRGCGGYYELGFVLPRKQIMEKMAEEIPGVLYLMTGRAGSRVHTVVCNGAYVIHDPATSVGQCILTGPDLEGYYRVGVFVMDL